MSWSWTDMVGELGGAGIAGQGGQQGLFFLLAESGQAVDGDLSLVGFLGYVWF